MGEMKVKRGKVHGFLGMTLDFSKQGQAKATVCDCVRSIVVDFAKHDKSIVTTATSAANHLFEVNESTAQTSEEMAHVFHNFTAKVFSCEQAHPDMQTAVKFSCSRVTCSDTDDWKKLVRLIQCLKGTPKLPLNLQADRVNVANWWVDAACMVHSDCQSHTRGTLSLGKGSLHFFNQTEAKCKEFN